MREDEIQRCHRCGVDQPAAAFRSESAQWTGICDPCWRKRYQVAASNTFGLLHEEVMEVDAGWRAARTVDGYFWGWLCPHAHPSQEEASSCPAKEGLLGPSSEPPEEVSGEALPWREPGPSMEETARRQIVSLLRRLVEEGGDHNFVIFESAETGGRSANYYLQFGTSCGSAVIYGEAVSNYYLERPFRLSNRQKAQLARLGWNPPRPKKSPNYYRYWQVLNDRDRDAVVVVAVATCRLVYGWRGDTPLEVSLHLDW